MRTLTYRVDIARPLEDVYRLASQVERHPAFIPDYLSCQVLERQPDRWLIERTAMIRGKKVAWQSWVSFEKDVAVKFVHQGGRLDGMHVTWQFEATHPNQTRMTLTQVFHIRMPGIGRFMETWIFGPQLSDIAQRVIQNFKQACELRSA